MLFDPIAYINEPRWMGMRFGLNRIRELLMRLGNPERTLRFIHVAGTNGKGSVCVFLARILEAAGYRTGLFTSPYIVEFSDRIQVDGVNIGAEDLLEVTLCVRAAAEAMVDHPSEFELMTAVAFLHFVRQRCDIVVCEVGLGGRLDSTNIIEHPEVCAITSLSFDHMAILGNTLEAIAYEKAGIIKQGVPVVSWPQSLLAMKLIERVATNKQAPLFVPDFSRLQTIVVDTPFELLEDQGKKHQSREATGVRENFPSLSLFSYKDLVGHSYDELRLGMSGTYQPYNAALALEVIAVLRGRGLMLSDAAIREGLASAYWPGRFELVAHHPSFIIDGAHNDAAVSALVESLQSAFPGFSPVFIMGVLADKSYESMIRTVLPYATAFVSITPPNPRALPADELATTICELLQETGQDLPVYSAQSVPDAIRRARALAGDQGLVCAFGSLYSVALLKEALFE